jgi:choline-sulfatase
MSDALVNFIDVGPTLAELAGGQLEYLQCGKSLNPLLKAERERHRDYVLSEYAGEIMYMDEEWKLVTNKEGEPYLLFHISEDPDELQNLIGAAEYEAVTVRLERKLMRALAENRCLKPSYTQMPTPRFGQEFARIGTAE